MHRKQVISAWRRCGNSLSPWERIESRLRYKGSMEKREPPRGRCEEKKNGEGTVKMNQNKVKPVSSWCYLCQAGFMKALQRVLWSLIFRGFGVHMVNVEKQGNSVAADERKDFYPIHRVENDLPMEEGASL